ncbi:MAG: hypothetical protein K2M36_05790, partial [Clostridia bacterium]|nr:hypothetical protein [Clostridia bacterium]
MNTQCGVRPAIHLNLTAASAAVAGKPLDDPQDITTVYNYDAQTVKSVYDAKPTDLKWYDSTIYEPENTNVALSYFDDKGAAVTTVKNAGTYWVKAEIQPALTTLINAAVDAEAPQWGWSSSQIAIAKAMRTPPKFGGTADTSDAAHVETDTVRWFKYTVSPQQLTVNKPTYNSATGVFTPPTFANSGELYADAPALATKFTGTATDGSNVSQINTVPTKRGSYTAQPILVKSSTDTTEYDGGNYIIKDATTVNCQVEIGYQKLPILSLATTTQSYTGSDIKFPLPATYNATWRDTADFELPTGVTVQGNDTDGWSLVAKTAGEYTITQKIKSTKNNDWCWAGPDGTEVSTDQTFKITVERKTLFVDFTSTSGAFVLQK